MDRSSSRNVSGLNSMSVPFTFCCSFPKRRVGLKIVVAEFRRGLDRWWICAALSPLVAPRGKCPTNCVSKYICKKLVIGHNLTATRHGHRPFCAKTASNPTRS